MLNFEQAIQIALDNLTKRIRKLEVQEYTGDVPIGTIIMWSGALQDGHPINPKTNSVNVNWALCDGTQYDDIQTPVLTDKFILGAGNLYTIGDTATFDVSEGSQYAYYSLAYLMKVS